LGLAEGWGAKLVLVHAVPSFTHLGYPDAMALLDIPRIEAELLADAKEHLDEVAAARRTPAITIETRAIRGDPFSEICQAAEREHADLVVIGSHGRTGLAHVFLGSVAERVVRHAPCPVLVVRPLRPATS
jgi:nucleotide-binding universal stress UspA family protein